MINRALFVCIGLLSVIHAVAQDTLPKFSVKNVGNNRIIIGWVNNFENVKQISIQRSFDSLKGYTSILTVADPTSPQNGYVDTKAVNDHMFYRLYILLDKGFFMFSDAKKPVLDTFQRTTITTPRIDRFPNGDSTTLNNHNRPANSFVPSLYVYTHRDGYVRVSLPNDEKPKKYSIKFFDEDSSPLFELKDIRERNFKIDKANFYHGGWFHFELYEDDRLLERHKFFLPKDF
jgi:hypothetical protein